MKTITFVGKGCLSLDTDEIEIGWLTIEAFRRVFPKEYRLLRKRGHV